MSKNDLGRNSEFMDQLQVAACNKFSNLTLPELPSIFLEFHGCTEEEVKNQAELVGETLLENTGLIIIYCFDLIIWLNCSFN